MRTALKALSVAICFMGGPVAAATLVGAHQDWSVFHEKAPKGCWIASMPEEAGQLPDLSDRDGVMFYVSIEDGRLVPSFMAGYDIDHFDGVRLSSKDETVMLAVDGNFAWPADDEQADKVIEMMRKGREMDVAARLNDETITRDRFSLMGVTAAMEQLSEECK
jgi:hypothetical protein